MKLEKAIEILGIIHNEIDMGHADDDLVAIKLGIEALKCIIEHRAEFGDIPYFNLPGETHE